MAFVAVNWIRLGERRKGERGGGRRRTWSSQSLFRINSFLNFQLEFQTGNTLELERKKTPPKREFNFYYAWNSPCYSNILEMSFIVLLF